MPSDSALGQNNNVIIKIEVCIYKMYLRDYILFLKRFMYAAK